MAMATAEVDCALESHQSELIRSRAWLFGRRIAREPLVQFFVVGAFLFGLAVHHSAQVDRYRIVVTSERVRQLTDGYRAEYGRAPTPDMLAQLIDGDIDDEVLYREGIARGLDRDDEIVRRRVVQKMQFLQQDLVAQAEPSEAELVAYYQAHRAQYAVPATVNFSHIYFSETSGGSMPGRVRAETVLATLSDGTARAPELGDNFPDLYDYTGFGAEQARRLFGDSDISRRLFEVSPGHWVGPVKSDYGWHLVRVQSSEPRKVLPFAAVRERVRNDVIAVGRDAANRRSFQSLKERFTVVREEGAIKP
jgi:peptidyl-prolyl cis-trans isomerase C